MIFADKAVVRLDSGFDREIPFADGAGKVFFVRSQVFEVHGVLDTLMFL
jgi:hypothetical protein